jgi:hypothetical protein
LSIQDFLKIVGLTLTGLGIALTALFMSYKKLDEKPIAIETLPIKSAFRRIETITGEPGFPSRSLSFEISRSGDISGTVESLSSDEIKLGIRPRTFPGGDLSVLLYGKICLKDSFRIHLPKGQYEITVSSTDTKPRDVNLQCKITDTSKPLEKYISISIPMVTIGVVVLMRGL